MSDNTPYVVKQVLKLYDMSHLEYVYKKPLHVSITVHIIFTPKKESSISPKKVSCYGVVNYYYRKGGKLEEMMLISELEMPILSYIDDKPSFYSFVEETIRDVADKKYKNYNK
jgi:hypothetical protein